MKTSVLVAALIASNAYGAACHKIEYVEAKDWPLEQIERAYCADLDTSFQSLKRAGEYIGRNPAAANVILSGSKACDDNLALFQRIRENIHKKTGVPACPKQK